MPQYTLAAHLIHSGLQMVLNRLDLQPGMDTVTILRANLTLLNKIAAAMKSKYGIDSDRPDYGQAIEMLVSVLEQDDPVYNHVIVHANKNNQTMLIMSRDGGLTFEKASSKTFMDYDQAMEMMLSIQSNHKHGFFHLEKRYWRG